MHPVGFLEVITGPMFAGKTSELIKRIERQAYAKRKVTLFKPSIDDRYSRSDVVAHNGLRYKAYVVPTSREGVERIVELTVRNELDVIGIDEVQFFPMEIVDALNELADRGVYVIASGLNLDFKAELFPVMKELLVRADNISLPNGRMHRLWKACNQKSEADRWKTRPEGFTRDNGGRKGKLRSEMPFTP